MEEKSYNVIDSVRKYAKEIYSKAKKLAPVGGLVATMYATPLNADLQIESRVAEGYAPIELVKKMDLTVYQGDSVLAGINGSNNPTCDGCVFLECITCQCPKKTEGRAVDGYASIEVVKKMDPIAYQGNSVLAGNIESNDPTCMGCVFLECITCQCPPPPPPKKL